MVDNTVSAVCQLFLYLMVHKVSGKLTGRAAAFYKPPADSVVYSLVVKLDDGKAGFRIYCNVTEIFAACYKEKLASKSRYLGTDRLPFSWHI